jgi:glycosyltransferase involved in cell wall biosynthesis
LLQRGDLFLCASDRQRDFWTGWLAAAGRVNPYTHRADPALKSLLRVVPFGVPAEPPQRGAPRFKGVEPGIGGDDFLVLWGGGVWNWFDPLTLIRAAAQLRERLPRLRVVFPALSSPSPASPPMVMAAEAQQLAADLGLTGSFVFFRDQWVPYTERGSMLLEADVGVSLHREGVETRYSFRTRVLDYLWGALPIITTEGDSLADIVRSQGLGAVVPYGGVDEVAEALHWMATHRWRRLRCARRCRAAAMQFRWPLVAGPLLAYCDAPSAAPDRGQPMPALTWPHIDSELAQEPRPEVPNPEPNGLQPPTVPHGDPHSFVVVEPQAGRPSLLDRVGNAYRDGGLRHMAYKGVRALRRSLPLPH